MGCSQLLILRFKGEPGQSFFLADNPSAKKKKKIYGLQEDSNFFFPL